MKKNVKKLNKKLKAILCLCLALLFSFSAFLFAGCDKDIGDIGGGSGGSGGSGGGENQRTFFENYVSGIAAVYANSEGGGYSGIQASQDKTNDMLINLTVGLLKNYGSGANSDKYKYSTNAPFYDSIRMLVTNDNGTATANLNDHWNWTIDPFIQGFYLNNIVPDGTLSYEEWRSYVGDQDNNLLYSSFPDYFSNILQIALYETMLGYEQTTLKVTVNYDCRPPSDSSLAPLSLSGTLYSVEILRSSNTELNELKLYWHWQENGGEALDKIKPSKAENANNKLLTYLYGEGGTQSDPTGGLAKEYLSKSRYVGLTKQNADKLIDYILTEIIGKELVLDDYNNYKNEPVNFRNYVETIAYLVYSQTYDGSDEDWVYTFPSGNSTKITYTFNQEQRIKAQTRADAEDPSSALLIGERGSFSAKPATYVKYFPGESFFGDPDATDQFAGKPYAEYQSIVIVPAISAETKKDGGIKLEAGFVFNFMTQNKNLRIIPKVRYCVYNEETGTQFFYEFAADEINFSGAQSFVNAAGQTCYEDDFDFGVDISKLDPSLVKTQVDSTGYKETTYTVGFFKNKELLDSVVDETRLTDQEGVQNFYKVVESKNGHGGTTVLNEKHIKSSFFEIVFDIVKSETDPENTDYNFSLVLSNSLLYPGIY